MSRALAPELYPGFDTMPTAGEWRVGASGRSRADLDPWSGEILAEIPLASAGDVEEAFGAALGAQREWAEAAPAERAEVLRRAAAILEDRKAAVLDWLVRESGGTLAKAELEWGLVRSGLHEAAVRPHHVEGRIMPSDVPGKESRVYRRPVGVVAVISPWSFPFQLTNRSVAPVLAMGNAVVLKPASEPGLFSEEFDVGQRQLRGNLPQAFVHALLLESSA